MEKNNIKKEKELDYLEPYDDEIEISRHNKKREYNYNID